MATAKEMLEIAGTIENAEAMARKFVEEKGNDYLGDLQLTLSLQGKFEEALEVNNRILKENPNDVRGKYNRGFFLAKEGKLLEGFKHMNEGRVIEVWGNKHIETIQPIWDGSGNGQHVLVNMEAGIGDQIIFARFIKDIERRGARPIVCCSPELITIFSRIKECSSIIAHDNWRGVYHDCWVPSMGLPVVMNTEYENLNGWSYLTASEKHVEKFSQIIKGDKLKIGIRWFGNPEFEHEQFRLFPEDLLFGVVNNKDFDVYGLQDNTDQMKMPPPKFVSNLDGFLQSWEDTAGAIANLDLVISSCTAVAHLAAAMGKPTWVIVPVLPYWAWALPGSKSPWHNSVKVFRQESSSVLYPWSEAFKEIEKELQNVEVKSRLR